MSESPYIAEIAALIGDPARANMLCALMDGRAHTAAELSHVAGVGAPTTSAHLSKLTEGGLLTVEKQGRHRYYRLASAEAAQAIEALSALAPVAAPRLRRPSPQEADLRRCRTCYDHLAGEVSVALIDAYRGLGWLKEEAASFALTDKGVEGMQALGVNLDAAQAARRRFAPRCLDWSERLAHLGGALGAEMLSAFLAAGWVARDPKSRIARITPAGSAALGKALGIDLTDAA